MFNKKTVKDIKLTGKHVLMRADYNVPLKNGRITADYRIKKSVATIKYILEQKPAGLVIISHLGRPRGVREPQYSLKPVSYALGELLNKKVFFAPDCVGYDARKIAEELPAGGVALFENLRFHPEEEKNDSGFAKQVVEASKADVFVQDGFGVVHRAHASTEAITRLLPSVAGLLLEKEVQTITEVMNKPKKPLVAIVGGAKISDKIEIINKFIDMADCVAVGGAMADDFLLAEGLRVGKSLVDTDSVKLAKGILAKARREEKIRNFNFLVPVDVVVSKSADGTKPTRLVDIASHSLSDIEAYPKNPQYSSYSVLADEKILDIGPISAGYISGAVKIAETVIWNGTLGVTEVKGIAGAHAPFTHGTRMVVDAIIGTGNQYKNKPFSLVGGGDTAGYVEEQGLTDDFSHVSTGGGASLELMSGHKLPGIEALEGK